MHPFACKCIIRERERMNETQREREQKRISCFDIHPANAWHFVNQRAAKETDGPGKYMHKPLRRPIKIFICYILDMTFIRAEMNEANEIR